MTLARIDSASSDRAVQSAYIRKIAEEQCRTSFGRLFEYYAPRLKSYLKRMGAEDAGAEEVVQDVMLTVWKKAGQFDEKQASVSTWIFRIARNRQIDLFRQASRPELSPEEPMLQPAEEAAPDETLSRAQIDASVREQLNALPKEQLDLLKAAFYDGLSHSEIAKAFDLPLGTVKSRIRLAFNRLRGRLQGEMGD
ncbi:MAG: sigma-70 family RNA polymerase sigma factor [Henriciella sp.]|mgnify:CR=1 FL=1|uniref:sigma-70 family RNA polymerase sigma factor n=1 Tax=Henriciella sp. TaxID=1968823 RepID=UPI00261348F2|nr:sigma-70 family RNA polymerase sigma factor [Henriciella sp.]